MERIKQGKFGLQENPIHYHVMMPWKNRTLLGEVMGVERDEFLGSTRLKVKHFCGESWPVDPVCSAVEILSR